tara:strand:- start:1142 stop:1576 length:435 start_codon:yes stop_codon:yes gene_type:complete
MANINIKFNGKEFLLSCEDGQEEHLEELSENLNLKFNQIKSKLGNLGENKLLLITSITLMDEYFETKKNIEIKKQEIDNLKIKFKELKSLVYGYKDQKDTEINELQKQQEKFKNELENLNNVYEKTIENASSQIEEFINKNNFS